jgi:hypothetical protein
MNQSYVYLLLILLAGFVVYFNFKDTIFNTDVSVHSTTRDQFEAPPASAAIEIRQAPIYSERQVMPSGPNTPSVSAPNNETMVYANPNPKDPYAEAQESSDIPENLRYPERAYRPTPLNDNTKIAAQAGTASPVVQVSNDNSQRFQMEAIQGGGEFMPGIFANDTFNDASYSSF